MHDPVLRWIFVAVGGEYALTIQGSLLIVYIAA